MKTILVLFAAVLLSVSSYANDKKTDKNVKSNAIETVEKVQAVDVTGFILDSESKESLAGAAITVDGNKYYSDLDGNYIISNLKPGKYTVKVELISYQPVEKEITVQKNEALNISLVQE